MHSTATRLSRQTLQHPSLLSLLVRFSQLVRNDLSKPENLYCVQSGSACTWISHYTNSRNLVAPINTNHFGELTNHTLVFTQQLTTRPRAPRLCSLRMDQRFIKMLRSPVASCW
ncbi:hypothetical protein HZ326_22900 [Fusarium oxysporum f. sp. albedinis]|nr:hypothetical protein HZ326_22900 [Fusarium oxysporum f. sp. albedinis]